MYLHESFVTSRKGMCIYTSHFRHLLQTVDARPHVNTVKKKLALCSLTTHNFSSPLFPATVFILGDFTLHNLYPVPESGANGGSSESFMERG